MQTGSGIRSCGLATLRASQINGCAYRVDMHYRDARKNGESEERLALVATLL